MATSPDCVLRLRDQGVLVVEADWVTAPSLGWRPRMFPTLVVPANATLAGFVGISHLRDLRAGDGLRVWVRGEVVTLDLRDTGADWVWHHAGRPLGVLERVGLLDALGASQRAALGIAA